jgi:hypothetical protein
MPLADFPSATVWYRAWGLPTDCDLVNRLPVDPSSEIQMFHIQCVGLNELSPGFDDIAHQFGEDVIGLG